MLEVSDCENLVSLGEREEVDQGGSNLLTSLRMLSVFNCNNLTRCICPNGIEDLSIIGCNSLIYVSIPEGRLSLKSLNLGYCNELLADEFGGGGENTSTSMMLINTSMPMLESLEISCWPNLKSIIDLSYFIHLTRLSIQDCPSMVSFPDHELANLESLTHLIIENCPELDASLPRGFWPRKISTIVIGQLKKPMSDWGQQNFPASLVSLTLRGGSSDEDVISFVQLAHLLPSSLTTLVINEFEKLETLSRGLQHLTDLQHLSINSCPKMKYLPDILLPLSSLKINQCPILKETICRRGSDSPRISHIPCVSIDHQLL